MSRPPPHRDRDNDGGVRRRRDEAPAAAGADLGNCDSTGRGSERRGCARGMVHHRDMPADVGRRRLQRSRGRATGVAKPSRGATCRHRGARAL
jgi:hypothetical protein